MLRRSLFTSAALVLAACGSDSTPASAPSTSQSLDVSALISQMAAGSVNGISGARSLLQIPVAIPLVAPPAAGCAFSSSAQGFVCPTVTSSGLTINLTYYLYDASGKSLSSANPAATASIRTVTDTKGTIALPSGQTSGAVAVDDHQDLTMSGLLATSRVLNGTSKSHFDLSLSGTPALHATLNMTSTTANVTVPATGNSSASWPISGSITTDLATVSQVGGATGGLTVNVHSVITFNGTSTATITTTVGAATTTCKIDLTGKTPPVC